MPINSENVLVYESSCYLRKIELQRGVKDLLVAEIPGEDSVQELPFSVKF